MTRALMVICITSPLDESLQLVSGIVVRGRGLAPGQVSQSNYEGVERRWRIHGGSRLSVKQIESLRYIFR